LTGLIITLRIIHILGAIMWVGTALFTGLYLFPALAASGPAAGPVLGGLQRRGLMVMLPIVAILTLLSGFTLFWLVSNGAVGAYSRTSVGRAFSMAGGFALIGFLIGMFIARPAGMQAAKLGQQSAAMPAGAEREALQLRLVSIQKRAAVASVSQSVLLVAAAIGMAVARYV
jgi:uncharacterized membrane protein